MTASVTGMIIAQLCREEPGPDHDARRRRQAGHDARSPEQDQPDQQDRSPADAVADRAEWEQQRSEPQRVRVDDPQHGAPRRPERQRELLLGVVEPRDRGDHRHERDADGNQDGPSPSRVLDQGVGIVSTKLFSRP